MCIFSSRHSIPCGIFVLSVLFLCTIQNAQDAPSPDISKLPILRAGIIGLDTSHVIAFTKTLNNPKATGYLAKVKVVAAYPGGSPDVTSSATRVKGFTNDLKKIGIEIVNTIPALLEKVDVVLLESVDGRPHLKQVIPVFKSGKPVFIDKPLAGSLADAIAIDMLGKKYKTPWFSSSSLRFSPGIIGMRHSSKLTGDVQGVSAWGPCSTEPHHPDLFWYGVHGCEILYTIMGTGCQTVSRVTTKSGELVTGVWNNDRIGTFRGIRSPGKAGYGAMVFGKKGIAPSGGYTGYAPLVEQIAKFFHTKQIPVDNAETLELFTFMEAADESKRQGGKPVSMKAVFDKAAKAARVHLKN
jgi:hypothetical protein